MSELKDFYNAAARHRALLRQSIKLERLVAVAKKFGAEGLIIRDAKNAELHYDLTGDLAPLALSLADTPVLVIMLLPADDGEPGVEQF
jgi:hypothetical protein